MRLFFTALLVGFLVSASSWDTQAQALDPSLIKEPAASPEINRGKLNFQAFCQECHGVKGAGTDKGPPFLHKVYHPGHHGDASFYLAVKNGTRAHHWPFGDMKPVEGVSDSMIKDIIAYVRALQKVNGLW